MDSSDLELDNFFTTNGKDIWKLKTYCLQPTCRLENLETGEKQSFGMGGIIAQSFYKIEMPEQVLKSKKC